MNIQDIKQRFEIIGNSSLLNYSLVTAVKVAPTDITVLINGESGVGKEAFSKVIHALSSRKHGPFIAVNCGAIPEGTIDSELFGHEKGSFTGALDTRKGYFETVNGGTIFLDEVGELPLETQARLLRVLESGEFIKVGSSKTQKTDVRIIAATNRDLLDYSASGKFREDLYYRLSTVPIKVPALRERKEDIHLLFRKFSADFAEKYEQLSVLDEDKNVNAIELRQVLLIEKSGIPALFTGLAGEYSNLSERDIFYKVLIDLRKDLNELKGVVYGMLGNSNPVNTDIVTQNHFSNTYTENAFNNASTITHATHASTANNNVIEIVEAQPVLESLSLEQQEIEMIKKALNKYNGKRKKAANELGISERTLYRKIKQYDLE
ncbi:MAG: sigma-54 dependent transcriptional regulator [Bacteroidetes bacterium]|nr:sigma-54 dependent transcriptional regulator [Bacteroidota bacterium]